MGDERSGVGFRDDPRARDAYQKMIETMRKAGTLFLRSEYSWESQGRELGRCVYELWMKKPNLTRIEARKDGELKGVLVGDGEYFWTYWPGGRPRWQGDEEPKEQEMNAYMKRKAPYSIAHLTSYLGAGMSMTIIQPSIFHGASDTLQDNIDACRVVGAETVGEEECDLVEISIMDGQRRRFLWLSRRDHLPRRLKEVVHVSRDIVTYERWTEVRIDDEIPAEKFSWRPPEGWREWRFPAMEEGLLKPGAVAPDFKLASTDGSKISLSDYRGRVVWLVFWRVGCPPCRDEVPYLEQVYQKHREAGLVVLGLNCADDREIALRFLRQNNVTFPNIVDASELAKDIYFKEYQKPGRSAVPMNYVVDTEGRVADAWYGYSRGDEHGMKALEKAGLKPPSGGVGVQGPP